MVGIPEGGPASTRLFWGFVHPDDRDGVRQVLPSRLDAAATAFAMTVHKSQGSEYPAVVIPMMMQHYMMLRRNLLYTGITRGTKLVVLIGQRQAVGMAVKGKVETRRWSKLGEWMV